jgi:hypothetical protein
MSRYGLAFALLLGLGEFSPAWAQLLKDGETKLLLIENRKSGAFLGVHPNDHGVNSRICQWTHAGPSATYQQWLVTRKGDTYILENRCSGYKLGGSYHECKNDGCPVLNTDGPDDMHMRWQFHDRGNGFFIIQCVHGRKNLEVPPDQALKNGAHVHLWDRGAPNAEWQFRVVE